MSAITPDSYIKLVKFDVTKEHQITFANAEAQLTYFNNLVGLELQASTYQRKDNKVRFPEVIDNLESYNYLIYRNEHYSSKTYFCYITNMEYVNDNNTDVYIKLDVFQTYQFSFLYKKCFVEREHVNDDTLGKNILTEGIEKGEFIQNKIETFDDFTKYCYMVQVSKDKYGQELYGVNIGGIYFSGGFYVCMTYSDVQALVQDYTTTGTLGFDCILNVFLVPFRTTQVYSAITPEPTTRKLFLARYKFN